MGKLELLRELQFGARVAEDEAGELGRYFVQTDQWARIYRGDVDIVFGPKGSGKSAIYHLINQKEDEFFDKNILLAPAEQPRGATVFQDIVAEPPTSEVQ